MFQNPDDQIFGSDVRGELEYMPRYHKWDEAKREARVARAADLTGIAQHFEVNPNDLPFAIKKFVAIGAILVGECKYVILDEPTAGLDSHGLALLNRMIDQLEAEGVSVITITHDMRFVVESFDRVVVMAHRTVIADGTATEVFANDADPCRGPAQAAGGRPACPRSRTQPDGAAPRRSPSPHRLSRDLSSFPLLPAEGKKWY